MSSSGTASERSSTSKADASRALSRNDKDLVESFPELRQIGEFLGSRSAVLDGEIVAFDDEGRPSFGRLQQRLNLVSSSQVARRAKETPASFLAFDLLYFEGHSCLSLPYDDRRKLLEKLKLEGDTFATPPSIHGRSRKGADILSRSPKNADSRESSSNAATPATRPVNEVAPGSRSKTSAHKRW